MQAEHMSERGVATMRDQSGGTTVVEYWRPIVWSAVIGGAVAALGIQLLLTLFGVGVGAALIDPYASQEKIADGIGVKAAICTILTGIISFGAGGYVAGRMSGVFRTGAGALHGVLAWAAAAVFGATIMALAGSATMGGAATGIGAAAGSNLPYVMSSTNFDRTAPTRNGEQPVMTEAERRAALDAAARVVAQASLITAVAFLLSALAAAGGGRLGRTSQEDFTTRGTSQAPLSSRPATA